MYITILPLLALQVKANCIEPVSDLEIFVISMVHGNMEFSLPPTTCTISGKTSDTGCPRFKKQFNFFSHRYQICAIQNSFQP